MEKVYPWSLPVLLVCRVVVNRLLGAPDVSVTTVWICIIQVLSSVWLFLPAGWPLPLLELLHLVALMIVHRDHWAAIDLAN